MEHGPDHGILQRSRRGAITRRWVQELHHRAGDRKKQHVDADACRKQHGHPGGQPVLRPRVVRAQPHAALLGQGNPDHKADHQRHRQHVVPAEVGGNPVDHAFHGGAGTFGQQDGPDGKSQDDSRRHQQNAPADVGGAIAHQVLGALAQVAARERGVAFVRAFVRALRAAKLAALNLHRGFSGLRLRQRCAGRFSVGAPILGWLGGHGFSSFSGRAAPPKRVEGVSGAAQVPLLRWDASRSVPPLLPTAAHCRPRSSSATQHSAGPVPLRVG